MQENLSKHFEENNRYLLEAKVKFNKKLKSPIATSRKLSDFRLYKSIGKGAFGHVYLVRYIQKRDEEKTFYALKILEKKRLIEAKQLSNTKSELRLLSSLDKGGDMFTALRNQKRFEESLSKFYAGQIVLAFEYMHYCGIVYRDLKPENILIDSNGYLKIADLGFCKKIDNQRTYTLCGTPDYMAPEIILGKGYSYSVDWWSLGVLIYEMVAGVPPFFSSNALHTYEKILQGKYICPTHFSRAVKDIVNNLLQIDKSKRFGVLKENSKDIKSHGWFNSIRWTELFAQRTQPNFKPFPNIPDSFETLCTESILRKSDKNEYTEEFKDFLNF